MNEEQIVEVWTLFREYLDKKTLGIVSEKYVDLLADYGVSDQVFKEAMGGDNDLDNAIEYYLDLDNNDDDTEDDN